MVVAMAGRPNERPGLARTDLVAELYQRKAEAQQAEFARAQQAQQAELARQRKARRRTVITSITLVVILVAAGIAGKLAFDAYRVGTALETAQRHVHEGTPDALANAAASLEHALDIDAEDPAARGTMALVRAQQAIDGATELDAVDAAITGTEGSAELTVATAIAAVLRNDYDGAQTAIAEVEAAGPNAAALRRASAWVRAQIALNELDDPSNLEPAIEVVEAALGEAPGWDRNHRTLAALHFHAGHTDRALELIEQGRELRATDAGLSVDEALYHAVLHRGLGSVETVTTQLLATPTLGEHDAARARLAQAIAAHHDDPDDDTRSGLGEAFDGLPPHDRRARAIALEVALGSGACALAEGWLEGDSMSATTLAIHRAWVDLCEDRVTESLEELAALPQTHPRVARVQALALVEQGRFAEAREWLGRAQEAFPHRPELDVAMARVDAQGKDASKAIERLEALSKDYPDVPRVWTGLAEAKVAATKDGEVPKGAEDALEQALKREAHPALAAYLMGRRLQAVAIDDPRKVPKALEMMRRAVELRSWAPAYRETLGLYLADVGDPDEARTVLESTADAPTTTPATLLRLSELAAQDAAERKQPPPSEIATWLALAAQRGAPADAMARTNARIALSSGTSEGVTQARAWISPQLRANPKDLESRLVYIDVLLRTGDLKGARAEARTGLRNTARKREGRLHVALARIELAAGKPRQATGDIYKGWRMVADEPRPANELLEIAAIGIDTWSQIRNYKVPQSIAKGLTRRVPYRAEAWIQRSEVQRKDDEPDKACVSAEKAVSLDDELPEAHLALAECKILLREREAAAKALEKAAELTADEAKSKALRRRARKLR